MRFVVTIRAARKSFTQPHALSLSLSAPSSSFPLPTVGFMEEVGDVRGSGKALTARRKCPNSSEGSNTLAAAEKREEGGER